MKTKRLYITALAAFVLVCIAATSVPIRKVTITSSATGTPVAIATNLTPVYGVTFFGMKGDRSTNAARVWIGVAGETTDNTQQVAIDPGEFISFTPAPGTQFNLQSFTLDVGTANDGVVVYYQQVP